MFFRLQRDEDIAPYGALQNLNRREVVDIRSKKEYTGCMKEIACYIHVPFCRAKCPYCDFFSLPAEQNAMAAYVKRCAEVFLTAAMEHDYRWKTLYLGGGTPSALPPELLAELLAAARKRLLPGAEATMECNPGSVTPELCETLAAGGINRVSMGLQSAIAGERAALGRTADTQQTERALRLLRAAGIQNISLDVMLGIPGQTVRSLEDTLSFCAEAGAQHVSAYLLKIEEGTPFGRRAPDGLPDEDAQAELYLHCCEWLEARGYRQYEVSNFALPGYESRHNLAYWRCEEYYAVGPAAHGFTRGRRWYYPRDLERFLRGGNPVDDGPGGDFEERAMLALRLAEGLQNPPPEMRLKTERFAGQGLLVMDEEGLRLTREGFLVSNYVIGRLL